MEGTKHDAGKPDLSLVPRAFMDATARALMFGEKKYARYNYRQGFKSSRLVSAALRHITAWFWVSETDEESGLSHLDHACACLAMLVDCRSVGTLDESDRLPDEKDKPEISFVADTNSTGVSCNTCRYLLDSKLSCTHPYGPCVYHKEWKPRE